MENKKMITLKSILTESKPQEFKSEITLRNPPVQIFEFYNLKIIKTIIL